MATLQHMQSGISVNLDEFKKGLAHAVKRLAEIENEAKKQFSRGRWICDKAHQDQGRSFLSRDVQDSSSKAPAER